MPQTLAELLAERLGIATFARVNDQLSTLGTAATRILRQDPNRIGFWVVNLSANLMHVGPFENVSSTRGILVGANGGNVILQFQDDLSVVGWEWFGVADAAGSSVLIVEYLLLPEPEGARRAG